MIIRYKLLTLLKFRYNQLAIILCRLIAMPAADSILALPVPPVRDGQLRQTKQPFRYVRLREIVDANKDWNCFVAFLF